MRWRQAVDAKRDAELVFNAASEGRPLELIKRLKLGKLTGGAWARGLVAGIPVDALEAARMFGHGKCEEILLQARGRSVESNLKRRSPDSQANMSPSSGDNLNLTST